jgi:hypothetical protein
MDDVKVKAFARELRKLNDKSGPTDKERAKMEKIQNQLAAEFGRRRGWVQTAKRTEACPVLFPWPVHSPVDHPYSYRMPDGRYAVASHVYDCDQEEIKANRALASEHNLVVEYPTDFPSWWYPGHTKLVVWYPASAAVQEQDSHELAKTSIPTE